MFLSRTFLSIQLFWCILCFLVYIYFQIIHLLERHSHYFLMQSFYAEYHSTDHIQNQSLLPQKFFSHHHISVIHKGSGPKYLVLQGNEVLLLMPPVHLAVVNVRSHHSYYLQYVMTIYRIQKNVLVLNWLKKKKTITVCTPKLGLQGDTHQSQILLQQLSVGNLI